jgi:hypothetical protein
MSAATPGTVRVFVNAVGVDVPAGSSVLEAIRGWSEAEAGAIARGEKMVTDSRGLPIDTDHRVSAGSIFRLLPVRNRGRAAEAADADVGLED